MTIELHHDMTNPRPTADTARTLAKKLLASIEAEFRLPAILANYTIKIQPWQLERIVIRVGTMPDSTNDLRVSVQRQVRKATTDISQRFTDWEIVPENCMEPCYWAEPVVREAVELRPEEDLRSYLTAWLSRSDMLHLIR